MLPSHDRCSYSAITTRPTYDWPSGKRLAVHLCLNFEHFAYNEGGGIAYSPGHPHPNTYNWAWREYGNRVGVWRLLELCDQLDIPLSVLLNSECYSHCPEVIDAFRARGDEILGHGRTNSEVQINFDENGERKLIQEVTDAISKHEGKQPRGWLSPGVDPTVITPDLLQEAGYTYILDWPLDDQPVWLKTRQGHILSLPYPHEVNDVPAIALHDVTASGFADMIIDQFDEMLEQSVQQPLVFGIAIHAFIIGQPYRMRQFRRAMEHIHKHRDRIWLTTTGQIADHFIHQMPASPD